MSGDARGAMSAGTCEKFSRAQVEAARRECALAELMAADAELEGRPFGPGPGDLATPPGHPPGEVGAGCLVIS